MPRSVLRHRAAPADALQHAAYLVQSAKALPSLAALGKKNCGRRMNAPISSSEYASSGRARRPRFDAIVAIRCASKGLPSCSMRQTTSEPRFPGASVWLRVPVSQVGAFLGAFDAVADT